LNTNIASVVALRDAAAQDIISLDAGIDKLSRISQSTSGAVAELAAIHQDHQARVEAWSMAGGEGEIPSLDRKLVARLEQERDNHEDSRASAEAGLRSLVEKRGQARLDHKRLDREVTIAALLVVINEDVPRIADEYRRARQEMVDRSTEYESLRRSIFAQSQVLGAPELSQALERLNIIFEQPVANGNLDVVNQKLDSMIKGAA